jgi:diguanylate cyclase (GGDEF)-like protein
MRSPDPQTLTLLDSLSALLGRNLRIVESDDETEASVPSRLVPGTTRLAIQDADDASFSEKERVFLRDMLEFILSDLHAKGEYQAIDQRLHVLEKENVDLSLKNRALTDLSSRDALTGLYTRWYVLEKIEAEMNRALRHGASLSLMMLDLDHFKQVNDSYGQSTGDHVLQAVGQVLRDCCRVYDIPGRYGGEEFCLMLPDTKVDRTVPVAERIRSRLETTPFHANGHSLKVTVSIGVAGLESVPEEALYGASSLIERADRALGAAKDRGRNRTELWSSSMVSRPGAVMEH